MLTILKGYCEIFKGSLPRTLAVFDGIVTKNRSPNADFLDVDAYSDLCHIPIALRRSITGDIRLMHGYSKVFSGIVTCLKEYRSPTSHAVDQYIRYSYGKNDDAKLFLEAGGGSQYALQYLFNAIAKVLLSQLAQLEEGLAFLPRCRNDIECHMVKEKLLDSTSFS